ncbi:hypothetical protein FKP32DRAFT_313649 [Trametes sanguinea]|nr:hypothetical protein FKP32DRAFT_313649 [Trametes sanguinea]
MPYPVQPSSSVLGFLALAYPLESFTLNLLLRLLSLHLYLPTTAPALPPLPWTALLPRWNRSWKVRSLGASVAPCPLRQMTLRIGRPSVYEHASNGLFFSHDTRGPWRPAPRGTRVYPFVDHVLTFELRLSLPLSRAVLPWLCVPLTFSYALLLCRHSSRLLQLAISLFLSRRNSRSRSGTHTHEFSAAIPSLLLHKTSMYHNYLLSSAVTRQGLFCSRNLSSHAHCTIHAHEPFFRMLSDMVQCHSRLSI